MRPAQVIKLVSVTLITLSLLPTNIIAQSRLDSTNYSIIDSTIDSSGGVSTSTNYSLLQSINPIADGRLTSGSYAIGLGFPSGIQANVPLVRCFETSTDDAVGGAPNTSCTDPALTVTTGGADVIVGNGMFGVCGSPGCYDRAKVEIDPQSNPIDTMYLVALSPDNFASSASTYYLKSDKTYSTTLALSNYLTICQLEGYDSRDTGCDTSADPNWSQSKQEFNIVGLTSNTTWYVKVRALSGNFTETQYSPIVSAATQLPSITLDLDINTVNAETASPYVINLGSLTTTPTVATNFIWVDLDTNAFSGASVFVADANSGLLSTGFTIPSETENLAVSDGDGGYGLQGTSIAQTSVGPLQRDTNFNLAANNVRGISTTPQRIFFTDTTSTNRGPIVGGVGQITVRARGDVAVRAGAYSDTITFTVTGNW